MLTSSLSTGVLIFVSKQCMYVFVLTINCMLLSMFCSWFVTFWKVVSHDPPLPLGNNCLWTPPPPRNFQWSSVGGGGVWIFSGTTHWGRSHKNVYFYFFLISVVIVVVFIKSTHRGVEDFNVLRMPHTLVTWMDTLLREKTHILSSCTNTKLNTNIFTSIYTVPGKLEGESRTLSELTPSDFLGCSSINGFQ